MLPATRLHLGLALCAIGLPAVPLLGLVLGGLAPAPTLFPGQAAGADWGRLLIGAQGQPGPLLQSLALALGVAALALPVGVALAFAEQRLELPGRRWLSVATLLPLAIPSYLVAATLRQTLGPGGWIGGPLGLPTVAGFGAALGVLTLTTAPYVQLLVGAALARCPGDEEEAARTLGVGGWRNLRATALPRLRPALAFSLLLVQLYVISDFGAVAVLDCRVLTWRLYQAVGMARFDLALSLSVGVVALTVPLLALARWVHGRPADPGVANPRPAARLRPRPAVAALVVGLQLGVAGLGALVPVVTLLGWVADGLRRALPFAGIGPALWDSSWLALVGALLTTGLALCPAWVAVRARARASWGVEQATYLTSSLPGVLLAFGLLLAALHGTRALGLAQHYPALLGSGVLLFAGFAIRFLAEAFANLKAGMALLDPRLEESARVLGATGAVQVRRVLLPQLRPALGAALAITGVSIVKELPVTLLLGGPLGVQPLSFRVFDRYKEALYHDAGLAGLLIVGLGAATFGIALRGRRRDG